MEKVPMTERGYKTLQEEFKHLKSVERPNVIQAISSAREHGDLSENAEYHAARERQSFIEGRIVELEDKLSRADVFVVSKITGNTVKFGATVELTDEETDEQITYQIVGGDEADVAKRRISLTSPVARALINKKVGASVEVKTPSGIRGYTIDNVKYID